MLFFILGLFLGSFLNNVAIRLEKRQGFPWFRSKCPSCQKILKWYELIPIFSFIIQKRKCRGCQNKISWRYPLTEIITGIWLYLLVISLNTQFTLISLSELLFYKIFLSILFILALYDLKTFLVDDKLILFGIIVGILFLVFKSYFFIPTRDFSYLLNYFFFSSPIIEVLLSLFLGTFLFLFIFLITKGQGIGFGDVKVAFLLGFFLKAGDILLSIIISSFFGSIYGFYLLLKTKNLKQPIPFIPFIFIGVITTIVFGFQITEAYFKIFSF